MACAPDNTPASYDDIARSSFMQACTGDAPEYNGTSTTLAGSPYCECAYDVFYENVPFNDDDKANRRTSSGDLQFAGYDGKTYVQYNNELKKDANALAPDVVDKLNDCKANPELAGPTAGTTPGTTPIDEATEPS